MITDLCSPISVSPSSSSSYASSYAAPCSENKLFIVCLFIIYLVIYCIVQIPEGFENWEVNVSLIIATQNN